MRRTCLLLLLISIFLLNGCGKQKAPIVPKSIHAYQQLNLTIEQHNKVTALQNTKKDEFNKINAIMTEERTKLLNADKNTTLTIEEKRAKFTQYQNAITNLNKKLEDQRRIYDEEFKKILTEEQKKIYDKYLQERDKELEQFNKTIQPAKSQK